MKIYQKQVNEQLLKIREELSFVKNEEYSTYFQVFLSDESGFDVTLSFDKKGDFYEYDFVSYNKNGEMNDLGKHPNVLKDLIKQITNEVKDYANR